MYSSMQGAVKRSSRSACPLILFPRRAFSHGLVFNPRLPLFLLLFISFQHRILLFLFILMGFSLKFSAYGLIFGSRYLSLGFRFSSSNRVFFSLESRASLPCRTNSSLWFALTKEAIGRCVVSIRTLFIQFIQLKIVSLSLGLIAYCLILFLLECTLVLSFIIHISRLDKILAELSYLCSSHIRRPLRGAYLQRFRIRVKYRPFCQWYCMNLPIVCLYANELLNLDLSLLSRH